MSDPTIRIAGVIRQSIVDGPGLRFVVFTQGCPHGCPGCHNPDTHDFAGGYDCAVSKILHEIDRNPLLKGLTLSGGEPFCRAGELLPLARAVRERGKDIWCYSGYRLEELFALSHKDTDVFELLHLLDVLVDGRFVEAEKDLTLRFRGSRNQRVLDVHRSLESDSPILLESGDRGQSSEQR